MSTSLAKARISRVADPFPLPSFATIAYRSGDGMPIWTRRYDAGDSGDSAFDVATSPDGTVVFVTGESFLMGGGSSFAYDYATVAYQAG